MRYILVCCYLYSTTTCAPNNAIVSSENVCKYLLLYVALSIGLTNLPQ